MIDALHIRRSTSPAVPAACALAVAVGAFARFGASSHALGVAFICSVLVAIAAIDIEQHRIPNVIVLPASVVVLLGQTLHSPSRAASFLGYGLGAAGALLVLALLYPKGLGMGDVKLALLLGLALGSGVVLALAIGFVVAAGFSMALLMTHSHTRKTA